MANQKSRVSVYLYIPNIIGYARILLNCVAFYISYSDKKLFSVLYFVSFVCDALDGWFARKFNQVSTFGAVLDMVTDRCSVNLSLLKGKKREKKEKERKKAIMFFLCHFLQLFGMNINFYSIFLLGHSNILSLRISTACLLVILSQIYRPGLVFLSLFALDIASHWLQMYSTFLVGKVSHKDVKDSNNWLFKAYYGNRMFMGYCCVACEVLYIILFLLAKNQNENLTNVIADAAYQSSVLLVLIILLLVGWAIKQAVNVIQMKTAADACVDYDINKKQKP